MVGGENVTEREERDCGCVCICVCLHPGKRERESVFVKGEGLVELHMAPR